MLYNYFANLEAHIWTKNHNDCISLSVTQRNIACNVGSCTDLISDRFNIVLTKFFTTNSHIISFIYS